MKDYLVIIEKGAKSWGAYSPDVPGCVAAGATREEVTKLFRQALQFHLEGLIAEGLPLPIPTSTADRVLVDV